MKKKEFDSKSLIFFGLAAFSGSLLIILTHIIRSSRLFSNGSTGNFIFGIMPNFAGSLLIIGILNIFHQYFSRKKIEITISLIITYSLIAFFSLFIYELVQFYIWNYKIDVNDIVASLVGCLLMIFLSRIVFK
jgi:hypothetical protein